MNNIVDVTPDEVQDRFDRLTKEAEASGYNLNPDEAFTKELLRGLIVNLKRYGYSACPCRLSEGDKWKDIDIICPCDYRDPDLSEFGSCYCALYVTQAVVKGEKQIEPVPERRLSPDEKQKIHPQQRSSVGAVTVSYPVWRCKVCGYLCARNEPPEFCPICRSIKDRFERFL